jgi:hypothetical protein
LRLPRHHVHLRAAPSLTQLDLTEARTLDEALHG